MISLSFPWLVFLVALLFVAILVLMYHLKSPIRKWVCFGLSFITIAHLLYIIMWHQDGAGQPLDWYLLGGVGVLAALVLSGVGFMDLVRPITNTVSVKSQENLAVLVNNENKQTDTDAVNDDAVINADNSDTINIDDVNNDVYIEEIAFSKEEFSAAATEAEKIDDAEDKTENELEDDAFVDAKDDAKKDALAEAERMQREELKGKVMPWFLNQLDQYDEEEQNAIKVCAIEFVNDGTISSPSVEIAKNTLYSQQRLMELCSVFVLLDKDRPDCAEFAKTVFSPTFSNTEVSTLEKKIRGRDKMQLLVDSYWEAIIR